MVNDVILIAKFKLNILLKKNNFIDLDAIVIFGTVTLVAVWSSRS